MYGYDLYGGDIGAQTANSYSECHKKCIELDLCKRWTFVPSKNQDCYLKEEVGDEVAYCHNCKHFIIIFEFSLTTQTVECVKFHDATTEASIIYSTRGCLSFIVDTPIMAQI